MISALFPMSPLKHSLIAAVTAAAITGGWLHLANLRRVQEAARVRYENDQMRFEASQRRSAHLPVVPLNAQGTTTPVPHEALATPAASAGDYRNEGQATPQATLQTIAWACDHGDTEKVAQLLHFESAGRAKAASYMATLPEPARASWHSPEEMAAALLTADTIHHPFPNATILQTATSEQIDDARVMLRLPGTTRDRTEYQRTSEGWKYLITEAAVDDYIQRPSQASAVP